MDVEGRVLHLLQVLEVRVDHVLAAVGRDAVQHLGEPLEPVGVVAEPELADALLDLPDLLVLQVGHVDEVVHGDDGGLVGHVQHRGADVRRVAAVVVDGAGRRRPVVQDVVEVAVVDEQQPARPHAPLEVGQRHFLVALVARRVHHVGERVAQADDGVEAVADVLADVVAQGQPVGLLDDPVVEGRVPAPLPPRLQRVLEHLVGRVHGHDLEALLQEHDGVDAGAGGHVQHPAAALAAQQADEEVAVVARAGLLVADEHLPHLGRPPVGVLVPDAFHGQPQRARPEHAVRGHV